MITRIEAGAKSLLQHFTPNLGWQWESRILSETPGYRLVTHYVFTPSSAINGQELIETVGKFYADNATGEHCYQAMCTIHQQLARLANSPLAIPEPIFYSPENRLLALKWINFQPYYELINTPDFESYLHLTGKALAYLHKLPSDYGISKSIDDHLAELITPHPLTVCDMLPHLTNRIQTIVYSIQQIGHRQQSSYVPVPLHRDFHLRQLFCDGRKVWLIDWDMFAIGDPALDVGNFLVYLATRIPGQSEIAGRAFLQGYRSLMPEVIEANINLYKALTFLRLACKAYRLQQPDWESKLEQYLGQCENLLAQEDLWR